MAVTFSQAEVDAFKAAMLKNPGVLEMRIGDRLYKFSTLKEMEERLAYMQRNLAPDPTAPSGAVRYASTSKGF
jgi:hypothetical protein